MHLAKTSARFAAAVTIFAAVPFTQMSAQEHHGSGNMPFHADFERMATKFVELAEAMPADKYSWRPMEGVRSVSEVFMLIAAENYLVPRAWGTDSPEGVPAGNEAWQALPEITAKEDVLKHLRASAEHFSHAIGNLTEEQLHSEIQFFGRTQPVMDAIYLISGDMHEHLGQAIAYARMNRIVPPWTARNQAGQSN